MRTRKIVIMLAATGGAMAGIAWSVSRLTTQGTAAQAPPAAEPAGRPRFVRLTGGSVQHGDPASRGVEEELPIPVGISTIGRSRHCDLRFHEATVSLEHAELDVTQDGHVVVRDVGSENGLRVDGIPVVERELHDGNRLVVGGVVLAFKTDLGRGAGGRQGGELG